MEVLDHSGSELASESAQHAMKDALIAETLGDVIKLRKRIEEIGPAMAEAAQEQVKVDIELVARQQRQFSDMAAVELEKINASYQFKADDALASTSRAVRKTAEVVAARESSSKTSYLVAGLVGVIGGVVGSVVTLLSVYLILG